MKLDLHEIEILCLAHITKSAKCMEKLLARQVKEEHFTYIAPGDKHSYTNAIFRLIFEYWSESGGSLFTDFVFESKLLEYSFSERNKAKLLNVWSEISDCEVDENNFYQILDQ